jgi:hypothetical protein
MGACTSHSPSQHGKVVVHYLRHACTCSTCMVCQLMVCDLNACIRIALVGCRPAMSIPCTYT